VFNIHQQVNHCYATLIVGRDGELNDVNIRQSGGLPGSGTPPAQIDGLKTAMAARSPGLNTPLHSAGTTLLSIFSFFFSYFVLGAE